MLFHVVYFDACLVYCPCSWIVNQVVSCQSLLFACMTSFIRNREQGQTLAAVHQLSFLIVSRFHMSGQCLASDSGSGIRLCRFVFMLSFVVALICRLTVFEYLLYQNTNTRWICWIRDMSQNDSTFGLDFLKCKTFIYPNAVVMYSQSYVISSDSWIDHGPL